MFNKPFRLVAVVIIFFTFAAADAQQKRSPSEWPTATAASVGLDEKAIDAFDADIKSGKYGNVDSLTIIRHGKLVFDRSYPHDYAKVYEKEMKTPDPLNAGDPAGRTTITTAGGTHTIAAAARSTHFNPFQRRSRRSSSALQD